MDDPFDPWEIPTKPSIGSRSGTIWTSPLVSWILICGTFACCVWFWFWPPLPGVAVTVLGGAAAILTFREMQNTHKFLATLAIFALMGIELRDIRGDRVKLDAAQTQALKENRDGFDTIANGLKTAIKNSQQQFDATIKRSDAIATKTAEAASFASGGNSFPVVTAYVVTQNSGVMQLGFSLSKQGKYPLYDLVVSVGRPYQTSPTSTSLEGTTFRSDEYNYLNKPLLFQALPSESVAYYTASMWARNGNWEEVIEARRIGSHFVFRWVLYGSETPNVTPSKLVFDLADMDFPASERHNDIYPLKVPKLPQARSSQ